MKRSPIVIVLFSLLSLNALCQEKKTVLQKITNIETSYPSWSPDGRSIVCQSNRNDGNSDIYVTDDKGGNIKRLTNNTGNDEYPVFSPDGRKIAFVSQKDGNQEIYLMDSNGGAQVNLTNHSSKDIHPQFSPDGRKLIFNSDRNGNFDLFLMDIETRKIEQLTDSPDNDTYAHWLPNGDKVVFAKWLKIDSGKTNTEIFLFDIHSRKELRLTHDALFDGWPTASNDGRSILFASNRANGKDFQIYSMNIDGSNLKKLTNGETDGSSYTKPVVAKDGSNRIVCTRSKDGNVEVFILI
jgi:TolB protein